MRTHPRPAGQAAERGSILLWGLLGVLIVAGVLTLGIEADRAMDRLSKVEVEAPAQAHAVAQAGLVDAFAWFRRQAVQPVTDFAPRRDLAANPPVNETDDAGVGLVRSYEIAPNLWARYEVRRTVAAEPHSDANSNGLYDEGESYVDVDADGAWDGPRETRDISAERGQPGAGTIWLLVSHGMVFTRPRADLALGEGANQRLAIARVATEIRRLGLTPPAAAALCGATGTATKIGNRARLTGGTGGGVVVASGTGTPTLSAGSEVTGSPATAAVPGYDGTVPGVFGVTLAELKAMADISTADASTVPGRLGDYALVVVDGDITFTPTRPLRGTGVVVILGDCRLDTGSNSFFNGLLWVGGSLTVRAPAYLRGTIIAQGAVDVLGAGGDFVEVNHDDAIIVELLAVMGQYRHTKAVYPHDQDHLQETMSSQ